MKLGIAYNVIVGEEHLEKSLKRMIGHVDYIILTIQDVANNGNRTGKIAIDWLIDKIPSELYDDVRVFYPNSELSAQQNELNKRNIGLEACLKKNCTHFMSIDCDEFYDMKQFDKAKKLIDKKDIQGSICQLVNYFKEPKYQMLENVQFVPFIFKINDRTRHVMGYSSPVPVDPTRRLNIPNSYVFSSTELIMHHMSYVRRNIRPKLENSPNIDMFSDIVSKYVEYFNNWKHGQPAQNPHQYKRGDVNSDNIKVVEPLI